MKNRLAVPLAAVCVAACQEDRQPTTGTWGETTDSGGIEIVENARPPEGSRLPWRIGPEPSLSIGVVEGEDPYMLGAVADAATLPGGRIAVADRDANEVRVFDASANHLVTLGRMGEGAGEFGSLSRVAPWPGDSIVAWEQVARRISVFDSLGNFGRSFVLHCLEENRWHCPRPQAARGDGTILSVLDWHNSDSSLVEVRDGEGMLSSSLGWHPNNDMIVARGPGGQTEPARAAYSREFVLAVWGDLVVAGRNSRYEIRAFHADGALARIVRLEHELRVPTEADRQEFFERRMALYRRGRNPETGAPTPEAFLSQYIRPFLASITLAEHFPAFSSILADGAGNLWVREYDFPLEQRPARLWTVFDPPPPAECRGWSIQSEGVDDTNPAVVLLRAHVLGVDGVAAKRPGRGEYGRIPIRKTEAAAHRNGIPEHSERYGLDPHLQYRLEEPHGVIVRESTGSGGAGRLVVELLENLHRDGEIRLRQELPRATTLDLLLGEDARRVEQHVRVDETHPDRSAVRIGTACRTGFRTGRRTVVKRRPRQVVGHAQPNATRVEVGEDLVEQPAPALKRRLQGLTFRSLVPLVPGRDTPQELPHQRRHRRVQLRRADTGATMSLLVNGYGDVSHGYSLTGYVSYSIT